MAIFWPYPHLMLPSIMVEKKEDKSRETSDLNLENQTNNFIKNLHGIELKINQPEENGFDVYKTDNMKMPSIYTIPNYESENISIQITGLKERTVACIPAILSRFTIQLNSAIFIDLPQFVLKLKKIDNNVKIIKCILMLEPKILFIKGYVLKNITYSTVGCFNTNILRGNLRHCTIKIPFNCTTQIIFNGIEPLPSVSSTNGTVFFNQRPYCRIEHSKIIENNQIYKRSPWNNVIPFTRIEEKMVLFLTFSIMQNQQISINF